MTTRGLSDPQQIEAVLRSIRDEFASLVHHELKTPLASILGATCLLESELEELADPACLHLLDILKRNTRRLQQLLENLLDLQRISAGQMTYQLERLELLPLVEEIAALDETTRGLLRFESIQFGRIVVYADRRKLVRAVVELLDNLRGLTLGGTAIRLRVERRAEYVLLHLDEEALGTRPGSDGAPDRSTEQLRQPRAAERASIGLALARELVAGMGGEILMNVGEGRHLTLRLPGSVAALRHSERLAPGRSAPERSAPKPDRSTTHG